MLPLVVGGAGLFGLVAASAGGIHLERAGYLYAGLALLAAVTAYLFMDNLTTARSTPREQRRRSLKYKHTWVMSFLYIGTFGSFIGYSAAMPLLIKLNFFVPTRRPEGTGINFAYYAFLGALVGSITRPFGGWLADKYGGARVTLATFVAMIAAPSGCCGRCRGSRRTRPPDPAIALDNTAMFPWFLVAFLFVFAATGIGNGSTYRMIPADLRSADHQGVVRA